MTLNRFAAACFFILALSLNGAETFRLTFPESTETSVRGIEFYAIPSGKTSKNLPEISITDTRILNKNKLRDFNAEYRLFRETMPVYGTEKIRFYFELPVRTGDNAVSFKVNVKNGNGLQIQDAAIVPIERATPNAFYRGLAPYPDWIRSLKANPDTLAKPTLLHRGPMKETNYPDISEAIALDLSPEMIQQLKKDVAPYMELSPEELMKLVPMQAPFVTYYRLSHTLLYKGKSRSFNWNPREPGIMRDETGKVVEWETEYPVSGTDYIEWTDGRKVPYTYSLPTPPDAEYQPVFGDVRMLGGLICSTGNNKNWKKISHGSIQEQWNVSLSGFKPGETVRIKGALRTFMNPNPDFWTAGIETSSPAEILVNGKKIAEKEAGKPILKNTFTYEQKTKDVSLQINLSADKNGKINLRLALPKALRAEYKKQGLAQPEGKIYRDSLLTTCIHNHLRNAMYKMAMLYMMTGDTEYANRGAAILSIYAERMPLYPNYGRGNWDSEINSFWDAERYYWFVTPYPGRNSAWYLLGSPMLAWPIRAFDMLKDAPIWTQLPQKNGKDAKLAAADGLLDCVKRILLVDSWYRNSDFVLIHNMGGSFPGLCMLAGKIFGEPELSRCGVIRFERFMTDFFYTDRTFAESVSYFREIISQLNTKSGKLLSYVAPEADKECKALLKSAQGLSYPDGSQITLHDSRSATEEPIPWPPSIVQTKYDTVKPRLYPQLGHGIIGSGTKPNRAEAHLHWSAGVNHCHCDMLNLAIWAYGDELLSDIGYTAGEMKVSALAHNLVVVDKMNQNRYATERGNLLLYSLKPDSQAIQAESSEPVLAYPQCSRYRRTVVYIPLDNGRNITADFFEVKGGDTHDYMANGCADYPQDANSSLKFEGNLESMPPHRGKPFTHSPTSGMRDSYGTVSPLYGIFRNLRFAKNPDAGWNITMTARAPGYFDYPGAGPRAKDKSPKPGLRIHWPEKESGTVYLGEIPRGRYLGGQRGNAGARKHWAEYRMPKLIVRREGKNLDSIFAAVYEPFHKQPFIKSTSMIPLDGLKAMRIETENGETVRIFFDPENGTQTRSWNNVSWQGKILVAITGKDGKTKYSLHGGTFLSENGKTEKKTELPRLLLTAMDNKSVTVNPEKELSAEQKTYLEKVVPESYIYLKTDRKDNRWFRISGTEWKNGKITFRLFDRSGLEYDSRRQLMTELNYPLRTLQCKNAEIIIP